LTQVANVRFNVAKTLKIVGPKLNSSVMMAQVSILWVSISADKFPDQIISFTDKTPP
jgi:hypothetical protein